MIKELCAVFSYPRKNNSTPPILEKSMNSLFRNIPKELNIEIIVVGDDYSNINELNYIFNKFNIPYNFHNININNALRNMKCDNILKWQHACTRSYIFSFKKCLESNYDYILTFSDDDRYSEKYFGKIYESIIKANTDFIFSCGDYCNQVILPTEINENPYDNYPLPNNTIATGVCFKSKNKKFINDIINLLENKMNYVFNNLDKKDYPQDYLIWEYLLPKFKKKIYTSYLIFDTLTIHPTERTIFKFI